MNKLVLCTLILFPTVLLYSCSKQIEGYVYDNFGKPLKDVEVSISNTQYSAQTNSKGEYNVDYVAGEVIVNFRKENYINSSEVLYISEKDTYPLKQITLYKQPTDVGIYIANNELSDYVKLKTQRDITTKNIKRQRNNSRATDNVTEFYLTNKDSLVVIKVSSLDDIRIYHNKIKTHLLGRIGADNKVGELAPMGFWIKPSANKPIKEQINKIGKTLHEHRFTPEFNVDYVYIFEEAFNNPKKYHAEALIFRFEKNNL